MLYFRRRLIRVHQDICGSLYVLGLHNINSFDEFMKFWEDDIDFRWRDVEEGIFEQNLKLHTEFCEQVLP